MKIILCLFLVSGINYVTCFTSKLSRDLDDIAALVPMAQDLFQIYDARKFNQQSRKASKYVASPHFINAMFLITKHPNMENIKHYLDLNGVDINQIFFKITKDLERNNQTFNEPLDLKLQSFIDRVYNETQMDNIISLVIHKTATCATFRTLYTLLNVFDYNQVYTDVINIPKVSELLINLNEVGINTNEVWRAMSYLFGWDKETTIIPLKQYEIEEEEQDLEESSLFKMLRQYLNLISKEKFIILYRGLLPNPLFQNIITYIYNKKYYEIIEKCDENIVIGKFFDYLNKQGVSFKKFLDLIRDRLGFTYAYNKIPTDKTEDMTHTFSMYRFFELAKQLLPINEIKKLTASLLTSDEEYKTFYENVHTLFHDNNVELYFENQFEIQNTALQYGFNINKILNFVFLLVGIENKVQVQEVELTENLYEFVELLPKSDYIDLYDKYKNDTNIWKIITYLRGPDFVNFVGFIFSTSELNFFIDYLIKQYVPIKVLLVDIIDRLGIMRWWANYEFYCKYDVTCTGRINSNSDNLHNFIQERINLFPFMEIRILFSKLKNNPYFQNLYLLVSNLHVVNLYYSINENDMLRTFFVIFIKIGYNLRGIVQQFSQLFDWENVPTMDLSLNTTVEIFDDIIHRKSLLKILDRYPDEVQELKQFFENNAFLNALNIFVNEPPIRNIITWMENLNVPVIDFINNYFGQNSPSTFHLKLNTKLKWKNLIADIVKYLNNNKFFAFILVQKYLSIEFHALLEKILALIPNINSVLDKHPDLHYVTDTIKATGIDLNDVYDLIEAVVVEPVDQYNK